jgi:hypothetical protein
VKLSQKATGKYGKYLNIIASSFCFTYYANFKCFHAHIVLCLQENKLLRVIAENEKQKTQKKINYELFYQKTIRTSVSVVVFRERFDRASISFIELLSGLSDRAF